MSNQDDPAGSNSPNEFAEYGDEETPVPYLPPLSGSPQQSAGQTSPALAADLPAADTLSSSPPADIAAIPLRMKGRWFLLVRLCVFLGSYLVLWGYYGIHLTEDVLLMRNGVTTPSRIVDHTVVTCGGRIPHEGDSYSVLFTDTGGQNHIVPIGSCDSRFKNVSVGDSITILYLSYNPAVIVPKEELASDFGFYASATTIIMIFIWLVVVILRKLI